MYDVIGNTGETLIECLIGAYGYGARFFIFKSAPVLREPIFQFFLIESRVLLVEDSLF